MWGEAKNRPCSFTWHPFSLQFKELGNIVNQREGEDGQNVPDRTKNFKNQSYDETLPEAQRTQGIESIT